MIPMFCQKITHEKISRIARHVSDITKRRLSVTREIGSPTSKNLKKTPGRC